MSNSRKVKLIVFSFLFCLSILLVRTLFAIENFSTSLLFEMKVDSDPYRLYFAGEPFAPRAGEKPILFAGGPGIRVDNQGNFYFLNWLKSIVKLNSKGEIVKAIDGPAGFTKPFQMELDRWDNLYVVFQSNADFADDVEFIVAKFDPDGNISTLIGDKGSRQPFKHAFLHVYISGTLILNASELEGLQRFDREGRFTGFVSLPLDAQEAMDGDIYVVDKSVKKYTSYDGSLKKTRGIKPVVEKDLLSKVKGGFVGFDTTNNLCFRMIGSETPVELPKKRVLTSNPSGRMEYYLYDFSSDKCDTLRREGQFKKEGKYETWYTLRSYNNDIYEIHIFFDDPPRVTPQDHVKFYKWEKVE
ncbi:MAG TPA: hypothetical protein VMT04_07350 [Terriglobales bacterium]|nr:hypothetical protein [Terriglobales bacterium]